MRYRTLVSVAWLVHLGACGGSGPPSGAPDTEESASQAEDSDGASLRLDVASDAQPDAPSSDVEGPGTRVEDSLEEVEGQETEGADTQGSRPADAQDPEVVDAGEVESDSPDIGPTSDIWGETNDAGPADEATDMSNDLGAEGHSEHDGHSASQEKTYPFELGEVAVKASGMALERTYVLASSAELPNGWPSTVTVSELPGQVVLRSGELLWDALFALAVQEARANEVSTLSDAAFEGDVPCECYSTGALWNWVWTRDIAYATDLGLAWLNPTRAASSLAFKLSGLKSGGPKQVVQDTGTGGSWPVSTDRVIWALGAEAVRPFLDEANPFWTEAVAAIAETVSVDRLAVFDPEDGLYRGETSFLDWREQTYATWVANDTVHIAASKALSTNLAHLVALRAIGMTSEAADLESAIDTAFWDGSGYRSFISTPLDGTPVVQQDLLGSALASILLTNPREVMNAYPFAPAGPPVIWPQQPLRPVYHNRGVWPFVTAYALLAARREGNAEAFSRSWESLVTGAAAHLSHLENREFLTGAAFIEDGEFSGPVVNSRRQLWSVAGFLGAVVRGVFGMEASDEGVRFKPFMVDDAWVGATLHRFPYRGAVIDVTLGLGGPAESPWVTEGEVFVGQEVVSGGEVTGVDVTSWQYLYAPQEPAVSLEGSSLIFSGEPGTSFEVWGDGQLLDGDAMSPFNTSPGVCYHVRARLDLSGHVSQPSPPLCTWPPGSVTFISALEMAFEGGQVSTDHGRTHVGNWGEPGHTLSFSIHPLEAGRHGLQLVYGNGGGDVSTGVTCGVKRVRVVDSLGVVVVDDQFVLPQLGDWGQWADSSIVSFQVNAEQSYSVTVQDGFNMSYLEHYHNYLGTGGGSQAWNYVNVAGAKLLAL